MDNSGGRSKLIRGDGLNDRSGLRESAVEHEIIAAGAGHWRPREHSGGGGKGGAIGRVGPRGWRDNRGAKDFDPIKRLSHVKISRRGDDLSTQCGNSGEDNLPLENVGGPLIVGGVIGI